MKLGVQQKKVTASDSAKPGPHVHFFFTLYLQGPKSLLVQIWYGDFYIWGIDAIKFLLIENQRSGKFGNLVTSFFLKMHVKN